MYPISFRRRPLAKLVATLLIPVLAVALGLAACATPGNDNKNNSTSTGIDVPTVTGTVYVFSNQGPGGVQITDRLTLGTTAWVADSSAGFHYWGTVSRSNSAYLIMVVTNSERQDIAPLGTYSALEIPGAILATFERSQINPSFWETSIGGAEGGTCPNTSAVANFVEKPGSSLTVGTEAIGTVAYTGNGSSLDFTSLAAVQLIDGVTDASAPPVTGMACSGGRFTMPGTVDFTTTPAGLWTGNKLGTNGGALFALPTTSSPPNTATSALYLGFSMRTVDSGIPSTGMYDAIDPVWARGTGTAIKAGNTAAFTDPIPAAGSGVDVTVASWANGKAVNETVSDPGCIRGQCAFRFITAPIGGKHVLIGTQLRFAAGPPEPDWHLVVLVEQ